MNCPHDQYLRKATCGNCKHSCQKCSAYPAYESLIKVDRITWVKAEQNTCHDCGEHTWVNIAHVCHGCFSKESAIPLSRVAKMYLCKEHQAEAALICENCRTECDIYAEGSTKCPTCFYGEDFVPKDLSTQVCTTCKQVGHINENGQCLNCTVELEVYASSSSDSKLMRVCPNCRKITMKRRKLCKSCERKRVGFKSCLGCGVYFTPTKPRQPFCGTCEGLRVNKKCTKCTSKLKPGEETDEHGWCSDCSENKKK